jgi:hypothetical protein
MRRRHLLGLGLFALLLLAIPLLVLRLGRSDSVNARSIARLQLGMTEREVDGVLGACGLPGGNLIERRISAPISRAAREHQNEDKHPLPFLVQRHRMIIMVDR